MKTTLVQDTVVVASIWTDPAVIPQEWYWAHTVLTWERYLLCSLLPDCRLQCILS